MKVGTDGVLLGAWAPIIQQPYSILDIGTGTGIIALMLAQRSNAAQIDALEIDEKTYEQATDNFENSPWNDRLFCFHAGLDEFMEEPEDEYDLIVSNPPFYAEDYKTNDYQRDLARFQDAMPFEDLIDAAALLTRPMLAPAPAASKVPTLAIPVGASLADVDRQLIDLVPRCGGFKAALQYPHPHTVVQGIKPGVFNVDQLRQLRSDPAQARLTRKGAWRVGGLCRRGVRGIGGKLVVRRNHSGRPICRESGL